MLQFCKNRLKIERNCRILSSMLVQNYMEILNKILSSVLWTVLAHFKSQPRGQKFQAQI